MGRVYYINIISQTKTRTTEEKVDFAYHKKSLYSTKVILKMNVLGGPNDLYRLSRRELLFRKGIELDDP